MDINPQEFLTYRDFEKLRCGKCKGYLNCPPILEYFEKEGYAECGRCYNSEKGPEQGVQVVRNHSLELLANFMSFPCKFYKNGCMERSIWPKIETHESECVHRPLKCPLSAITQCDFEGMISTLMDHVRENHTNLFLNRNTLTSETFKTTIEQLFLINQASNLYLLQIKYEQKEEKAWIVVNLLENKDPVECSLDFVADNSNFSFSAKCLAEFKPIKEMDVTDALELDFKMIRTLLKSVDVQCRITVNVRISNVQSVEFWKEIQCPVCWDDMRGRIFICKNGHNVCSKCKEFVLFCPVCRGTILDIRNLLLEKIISCALFPCKNYGSGCSYVGTLEGVIYHSNFCTFKI